MEARDLAGRRWAFPVVLVSRAAPEFWIGMVLLAIFSFNLHWFPSGGANATGSYWESDWHRIFSLDFAHHLALPAITLAVYLQGLPLAADAVQHAGSDAGRIRHHGAP